MELKIGLIDADRLDNKTRHPNLALMKISNFCKSLGFSVKLLFKVDDVSNYHSFDIIIISKVFTFTKIPQIAELNCSDENTLRQFNICIYDLLTNLTKKPEKTQFAIGGTGFFDDGGRDLHPAIEHIKPDYELYSDFVQWMISTKGLDKKYFDDYENYSIGFMTRGCFRKCPFCVNKKYDKCLFHAHVSEFIDEKRAKIYLWDDNVLACSSWRSIFDELDATGKQYQFRQGLDIRLIDNEKAERISKSRYYGDTIFAFDNVDDYDKISKTIRIWKYHSKRTTKLYVLCGFDPWLDPNRVIKPNQKHLQKMYSLKTQIERDQLDIEGVFVRIELLMRYGCLPYIMRHQNYQNSIYKELYIQLARWCNQPQFFKKKSFAEFCIANQEYAKSDKICAAYQAYLTFKNDRPDLAEKYFNMKFEEMNATRSISSFGRNDTIPCIYCNAPGKWDRVLASPNKMIIDYYRGELDQLCLLCKPISPIDNQCIIDEKEVGEKLCKYLLGATYKTILAGVDQSSEITITSEKIPQLNQFKLAYEEVIDLIDPNENNLSYKTIGSRCILSESGTNESNSKYGECQTKLLMMMDLVWKDRSGIKLTPLGVQFQLLSKNDREVVFNKLILKIPIVQHIIKMAKFDNVHIEDILSICLKPTTVSRRSRPLKSLISSLHMCDPEIDRRISNIK